MPESASGAPRASGLASPAEHPAIVLTLSATGLAVARSLAARGVRVFGVDATRTEIGHFSRHVTRDERVARLAPGPELLEGLLGLAAEQVAAPVLYPAGDLYLDFAVEHHEALREVFVLPESLRPEGAGLLVDKRSFYARCKELAVALPKTFFPEDDPACETAARELRYPAIVKPTQGHLFRKKLGGAKLVEVHDAETLLDWWRRFRDWGGEVVLQEVVPGPETNIFVAAVYASADAEIRALFTARKSRQYPPNFGSGSYMEACWADEIASLSADLVQKLGYAGVCGTEYKWDPRDQLWKLIELNPRPTLWFSLPLAAGVDVIWDAHCDLVGRPNPPSIGCQDDSRRWQLPLRDLLAATHFLATRELGALEFLRTLVDPRRKTFGDVSLADPATLYGALIDAVAKYRTHRVQRTNRTQR